MLVAGEAGIGKTVLLRAFVERVRAQAQPLWGMCDSLSTPRPLGPLRDVADELGAAVPDLLRGTAAQHEIFAAVLDALRSRPRVFVVEDLHWADEATLDLVRFLARRIAALPLLLVLSYRDTLGVDHPLSPVLGDLVSAPDARRLQLTPLSRAAVAALLDGHGLDPADVHRRTAGNPFFVSQILAQPDVPAAGERPRRRARPDRRAGPVGPALPGAAVVHARTGRRASCSAPSACRRRRSGCSPPPAWSTGTGAASRSATRSPGPRSSRRPRPAPSRRCTRR